MDNDSHTFGIGPKARVEEIMCDFYVCNVRLIQLEMEATWGEDGCESEVELAPCETAVETLGQLNESRRRQTVNGN